MLDEFTLAYIDCALWASTDDNDTPMDENYGYDCLAPEALEAIKADCKTFQSDNWEMIAGNLSRAGHDFWLTRNGHGAGFWDGDWPDDGDALTEACKRFRECDLYVGDDGLIYIS